MDGFECGYLRLFTFKEEHSDGRGTCTDKVVHEVPSNIPSHGSVLPPLLGQGDRHLATFVSFSLSKYYVSFGIHWVLPQWHIAVELTLVS